MTSNLQANNTITTMCSNTKDYVLFAGYNNTEWSPYTPNQNPPIYTYNNVFNLDINQQHFLTLQGSTTFGGNNFTIKNSVYDSNTSKTYICGSFTNSQSTVQNITYLQGSTWFSLGLTFNMNIALKSVVNCMVFNSNFSYLYIGGIFNKVTDSSKNDSASYFAEINVSNYTVSTSATAPAPPNCSQINSLVLIEKTLYVGGIDTSNNIYFYSYNTISSSSSPWTNLLTSSLSGSINILYNIPSTNILAIGGQFTTIETANNCNNIVLYDIVKQTWTPLGTGDNYGVTGIGTISTPLTKAEVNTITSNLSLNKYIFIGGYFMNAGGTQCNSLVMYNLSTSEWKIYYPPKSLNPGVLYINSTTSPSSTDPGIIYSLIINISDNSNLLVAGSFYIIIPNVVTGPTTTYNLFKVTTNVSLSFIYSQFYYRTII